MDKDGNLEVEANAHVLKFSGQRKLVSDIPHPDMGDVLIAMTPSGARLVSTDMKSIRTLSAEGRKVEDLQIPAVLQGEHCISSVASDSMGRLYAVDNGSVLRISADGNKMEKLSPPPRLRSPPLLQ